jgi:hypothetical protein
MTELPRPSMWPVKKSMENKRTVECGDALLWLSSQDKCAEASIVASMPDISEFTNFTLTQWKEWFTETAALIMSRCPDDGVCVFYQSDIKYEGVWVDKAYLVQKAAEKTGLELLWHKVVCRVPPGIATFGKPAYSHILCFSKNVRLHDMSKSTPDVIGDLGEKTWVRGMGLENCLMITKFIKTHTNSKRIVHPFCGEGSILAAANFNGLDAYGIERSPKRAEKARTLSISADKKWVHLLDE